MDLCCPSAQRVGGRPWWAAPADVKGGKVDLITANSVANTLTVLPLGITGVKIPASGQFQFSFDTASGVNYVVQYSTNLNQWFQLITVGGVGFPMTLTDPMGGNRNRFYRILLSP